jgi:uncharacterized protein (DUF486 family)
MPSAFWQATGLLILSNVFMPFAWYAGLTFDDLWAALCILGAVYFVFRDS